MVASVRTSSLLAVLVFGSALTSCMTLNHGYLPKAGQTVVSLDSALVLPIEGAFRMFPVARVGVVHAVSDWFAVGLNSSVNYAHYNQPLSAPQDNWFIAVSPSIQFGFYGRLGSASAQLGLDPGYFPTQGVVLPGLNLSWAYSYDFKVVRPYLGIYCGGFSAVQQYIGIEVPLGHWVPYVTVAASAFMGEEFVWGPSTWACSVNPGVLYRF